MPNKPHDRLSDGRDRPVTSARSQNEPAAMRVTLGYGSARRFIVLENPPFPKVGDLITVKGEGAEWVVLKVKPAKVLARIKVGQNVPDVR